MMSKQLIWIVLTVAFRASQALIFREDQFTDMTKECLKSDGKPLRYILNEDNPAMYVSVDSSHDLKKLKRAERTRLFQKITSDQYSDRRLLQDLADSRKTFFSDLKFIKDLASSSKQLQEEAMSSGGGNEAAAAPNKTHFDCKLQFETELPQGDKSGEKYDALSLFIIEYHPSPAANVGLVKRPNVEIITLGHEGYKRRAVTKNADYSNRLWPGHNPNFLLSGQLSGLDSSDFKTKVDAEHLVKPETLHSTFDKPASVTISLSKWYHESHIYMVITSYKYLKNGERCQEGKEFDCSSYSFLSASPNHMCMNTNLACDGVPNCGQSYLPNQDENCFKIHWSSVLLSLVSYILLAITLLLCLSCFARVLIQWSVRSSLAELRTVNSPTGSFRSSSRFFSFLGTTFTGRWERPPPTYDEALKHVNPDLARPTAPPPYNDFTDEPRGSVTSHGIIETPPPQYQSQESGLHRFHLMEASSTNATTISSSGDRSRVSRSHHHRRHRHNRASKSKTSSAVTTSADVLPMSSSAEALLLSPSFGSRYPSVAEAASSPMSPLTMTSVEINNSRHSLVAASVEDLEAMMMSPSRFSSNSINTVILNPGAVSSIDESRGVDA